MEMGGGGLGPLLPSFVPPANVVLMGPFCDVVLVVDTVVLYSSAEEVIVTAVVGTWAGSGGPNSKEYRRMKLLFHTYSWLSLGL